MLRGLAMAAVVLTGAWGVLALWFQCPGGVAARWGACVAWGIVVAAVLACAWRRRGAWPWAAYACAFAGLLAWWGTIRPSNHRDWADDVARPLAASVDGRRVTLRNVRDFDWRSDTDYDVRWLTRRYDLDALSSADVVLSSWGVPGIAHALVSFGFDDGSHVVFSVEIRRERSEAYSALGGFFREFELAIVAATERDIIRVRTNVRGEHDQLYRLRLGRPALRAWFLAYARAADRLAARPAFYNTLGSNCATVVYRMTKPIDPSLPWDYRLLLTGYLPAYLYKVGVLDRGEPLGLLERRADITARARAVAAGQDFSRAIRTPAGGGGAIAKP